MVIIAFDGHRVPNFVRYGPFLMQCSLYRKQIDVRYTCGRLGHRADVGPTLGDVICRGCGALAPMSSISVPPSVNSVVANISRLVRNVLKGSRSHTSRVGVEMSAPRWPVPTPRTSSRLRPPWVLSAEDAPVPGAARETVPNLGAAQPPEGRSGSRTWSRGRACSRGRSGSRLRSSSMPGHDTSGRIRSRSRTSTALRSKKPTLSWADMADDDLRSDLHHANALEELRRVNEQLRKLALSPSPAQPASVPVAMGTCEASHGSSAPKRRAVENRQEDETIKLLSELKNSVASMQASLVKVQAAITHRKMGLGALNERISKSEEIDARSEPRPAPSQVAAQRNVLQPPTEGAILRATLSAQPSPQPRHR
ncbi:hypothetical protein HPB49_025964 [Dermacentor silvarum]|nr:hypothetical protein HPB49_025964 [Dermacentor silvarum]